MAYSTLQVPFPSERYAEIAMRTIGVDEAFSDSKTKKHSIEREMFIEVLDNGTAYLTIKFSCAPADINSMRTCASSFYTNLILVCQTMHDFGN